MPNWRAKIPAPRPVCSADEYVVEAGTIIARACVAARSTNSALSGDLPRVDGEGAGYEVKRGLTKATKIKVWIGAYHGNRIVVDPRGRQMFKASKSLVRRVLAEMAMDALFGQKKSRLDGREREG